MFENSSRLLLKEFPGLADKAIVGPQEFTYCVRVPTTRPKRSVLQKTRIPFLCFACLLAAYLLLVWVGGGWSPRHDERFAWDDRSVLLFAHRGVTERTPENSESAFDHAERLGFEGIELDIRKTKDKQLAIFHDRSALRMLGTNAAFGELTLAEIEKRGLLFHGRETTNHVPTLREIFEKYGHTFRFYLDMKNKGFADADLLARLIQDYGLEERTIVASVDPLFVAYMEHRYPRVNTALERFDAAQVWLYRLLPSRWKPDYLSGFARKASRSHVEWLKKNHLLSNRIVYEVNQSNYQQVLEAGIAKAIVDYVPGVYSAARSPPPSMGAPGSTP
jgi:glycerophosphoryl diester phosphodiesterase